MLSENTYPKPMSDFSLPYLKDIPVANRKAVMTDEWKQTATKEMMIAVRDAEMRWKKCFWLLHGKIPSRTELERLTVEWPQFITKIILALHNDVIVVAENRNEDTRQLKEAAWSCASALGDWSKEIARETNPHAVQKLARIGIEFLKSHDMTLRDALYELQLILAREVKTRTGI